ncbi:MAG: deoxyribodipyrimidine photo-lyase/cryptochrome family protein [Sphingomonadaceae bacterium]|nr:deoxyribodipyrimidine photo-lyase/cryptochrome family protein [Sphingomonadaceae bacterium]
MSLQVLWFKRDLRLADHAALCAAAAAGPVLPLFIVEPEYWALPDTSYRQWEFWRGCVADLAEAIRAQGGTLCIAKGDAVTVLEALRQQHGAFTLWAHEETGNGWTYVRDRRVKRWAKTHGIAWHEQRQFGVLRGPGLNRDIWAGQWETLMRQPLLGLPKVHWAATDTELLPNSESLGLMPDGIQHLQQPGREVGIALLTSFLHARGQNYTREMSSPVTAEAACSRLSPYLTYGALSMREVFQAAERRLTALTLSSDKQRAGWAQSMRSFIARLHWHCHFIQKLESEPEIEHQPFARMYVGMRPQPADPAKLAAWAEGRTGYPFIDAAMRYLTAHGWINFRMRAMLMSFAAYDLWLPWQEAGLVLARKFVDFEPGIHWSQCQMQSGETGINTVRVYSPVKQGHDQDPKGDFIRQWVPELAHIKGALVHEPWRLARTAAPDYPPPIVDHKLATAFAKDQIFQRRKQAEARAEADAVFRRHGSRAGPRARRGTAARSASPSGRTGQLSLDL